jgi:hypothetical protein
MKSRRFSEPWFSPSLVNLLSGLDIIRIFLSLLKNGVNDRGAESLGLATGGN